MCFPNVTSIRVAQFVGNRRRLENTVFVAFVKRDARHMQRLRRFDLRLAHDLHDASIKAIADHCPAVEELLLPDRGLGISEEVCKVLSRMASLRSVAVGTTYLTEASLACFTQLTAFSWRTIHGRGTVPVNTVLTGLRRLELRADVRMSQVYGLTALEVLSIDAHVRERDFEHLARMPWLRELRAGAFVQGLGEGETAVIDDAAPILTSLPWIATVDLGYVYGMPRFVQYFPGITSLRLRGVSDGDLSLISSHLKGLALLCLDHDVRGAELLHLSRLKALQELRFFAGQNFTDEHCRAMLNVGALSGLRRLVIDYSDEMTDAGLFALAAQMPRLTHLALWRCEHVTRGGMLVTLRRAERLVRLHLNIRMGLSYGFRKADIKAFIREVPRASSGLLDVMLMDEDNWQDVGSFQWAGV